MYSSGLLIIPPSIRLQNLGFLMNYAKNIVSHNLFLTLPERSQHFEFWKYATTECYNTAYKVCPSLNVYLLLPSAGDSKCNLKFDIVLSRESEFGKGQILNEVFKLDANYKNDVIFINKDDNHNEDICSPDKKSMNCTTDAHNNKLDFPHVCLGGTFDRLHHGHRILLTIGALLAQQKLLIGITDSNLLFHKPLAPLIESWTKRCANVRGFLQNIGFRNELIELVKLEDSFGPPSYLPDFHCIISSTESLSNCERLNEIRSDKGFKPLHIELIDLLEYSHSEPTKSYFLPAKFTESKLSSSAVRFELLGNLLKPVNSYINSMRSPFRPYIIGLVGPAGSGKSAIAKRLVNLSSRVHVIDCDKLGHKAYEPGTKCHQSLLQHFGLENIASPIPPHPINRQLLASLVFSDSNKLKQLNEIVWPEISKQYQETINQIEENCSINQNSERHVVILDAAVLLQAKWDQICDEIWVTILPRSEAERRLCERNKLTLQAASERITSQASAVAKVCNNCDWFAPCQMESGAGPIDLANVILSTEWEPEFSQKQAEKAWHKLLERLP